MDELTPSDVEQFTDGRIAADGLETPFMLEAALIVARRYTGWHVSPVIENHEIILDGPCSRILYLPTKKIIEDGLTSIEEDETLLTLTDLRVSVAKDTQVRVRKKSGAYWSCNYGSIEIVMSHGYTKAEAGDWRRAVLTMVDQMSLVPIASSTGQSNAAMTGKKVDDVEYQWSDRYISMAENVLYSVDHILCSYELPPVEYM